MSKTFPFSDDVNEGLWPCCMLSFIRFSENTLVTFFLFNFCRSKPDSVHFRSIVTILGVNTWWPEGACGSYGMRLKCVRPWWEWEKFVSFRRRSQILCFICSCDCKEKSPRVAAGESSKSDNTLGVCWWFTLLLKYSLKRIFYQQHELWSSRFAVPSAFLILCTIILLPRHSVLCFSH